MVDRDLTIEHKTGSNLETDRLSLVGSESGNFTFDVGPTWETGEKVTIPPTEGGTVRLYWYAPKQGDSATLLEYRFSG